VAKEAEAAKKDGRTRWENIGTLQRQTDRHSAVLTEDGTQTQSPSEVLERWWQHFVKILNVTSKYGSEMIIEMPTLPCPSELDLPPSEEELIEAMCKMKKRKAGVKS